MKNYKKIVALALISTFTLVYPVATWAQEEAADTIPPVPISDAAMRSKEVGITIFGITIPGVTYDSIAIGIAKITLEEILNETIEWVNNGFEGNPAYATDPAKFFTDIADGIAGDFIAGSDLGFLCSPFQAQIRLALQKYHTQRRQFQCTMTGVVANIEAFTNDFSQGGWDGWFVMTQNDVNNPYGAYIQAQIELDSRIAKALGIQDKQLKWDSGFLSWADCDEEDPDTGECLQRGPVKTPGKVIESQLEGELGTGIRQLELADELDELINALFTQLLKQLVFGAQGLFSEESSGGVSGGGGGGGGPVTHTLNIYKSGTGLGIVTSSPAGINCGSSCFASYPDATFVTLTASSTASSTFAGWFGGVCPSASSPTCALQMFANINVTAIFDR